MAVGAGLVGLSHLFASRLKSADRIGGRYLDAVDGCACRLTLSLLFIIFLI